MRSGRKSYPFLMLSITTMPKKDPLTAMTVINDCFALVVPWLPRDLLQKLTSFPFNPQAPSSLLIHVDFPVGKEGTETAVPPTPQRSPLYSKQMEMAPWRRFKFVVPFLKVPRKCRRICIDISEDTELREYEGVVWQEQRCRTANAGRQCL